MTVTTLKMHQNLISSGMAKASYPILMTSCIKQGFDKETPPIVNLITFQGII
jgi:hypothetical protein